MSKPQGPNRREQTTGRRPRVFLMMSRLKLQTPGKMVHSRWEKKKKATGQRQEIRGSITRASGLEVSLATEPGLTVALGPHVPRISFRGSWPKEQPQGSMRGVYMWPADSFPPSKSCKRNRGHPGRPTGPGPLCSLSTGQGAPSPQS